MKDNPTLADGLLREFLRPFYTRHKHMRYDTSWILKNVSEARKFVLDQNMSAFLSDLAYSSISNKTGMNRRSIILESMRRQAHLPHKATWIEYDFRARATRAVNQYGSVMDLRPGQTPDRCGWLCLQHPQLETAFMALECTSHTWAVQDGRLQRLEQPAPSLVAYTWRTDDGPPPWTDADIAPYFKKMGRVSYSNLGISGTGDIVTDKTETRPDWIRPEAAITGIFEYQSESVKVVRSPHISLKLLEGLWETDRMFNPLKELAGDLRYLWAFLATLNDLPTSVSDVRASKGFVARGRYRKFVDHKVIHLHIPEKRYTRVAAQAIAIARRRAYPVRKHFRIDYHHRPSPMCDHIWGPAEEKGHLTCNICHGRKLLIHEHMRGDSSLGIVTHDYVVEHEKI